MDDEKFSYLCSALKSQRNLTHLDISMNEISADGVSMFVKTLKFGAGHSLQYLDLSYNPIGELGKKALPSIDFN